MTMPFNICLFASKEQKNESILSRNVEMSQMFVTFYISQYN